jgi:MarR family transcriptional regulator, lower aerobic nicotinate degradation pathway regulator
MSNQNATNHEQLSVLVADVLDLINTELITRLAGRGFASLKGSYRVVFRAIGSGKPVSVGDLARNAGVTTQAISQLVREMEAQDLVTRSPDPTDLRVSLVTLTPTGRRAYKVVQSIHSQFETEWTALLNENQARQFRKFLSVLKDHLD